MSTNKPLVLISSAINEIPAGNTLLAGISALSLYLQNVAGTFFNQFVSTSTAARTFTLQDKSYTLAGLDDITTAQNNIGAFNETPSGTINSTNTTFTISQTPLNGFIFLTINGLKQTITTDYALSGTTITFTTAPKTGSIIEAYYFKVGLVASGTATQTIVSLGDIPIKTAQIKITDSNAYTTSKIMLWVQQKYNCPLDELEMDNIVISGNCGVNGTINCYIASNTLISGSYIINYTIM